ncbi:MAG: hypothetical protein WA813_11240, partial [Beijerinckiaceae bacterium]
GHGGVAAVTYQSLFARSLVGPQWRNLSGVGVAAAKVRIDACQAWAHVRSSYRSPLSDSARSKFGSPISREPKPSRGRAVSFHQGLVSSHLFADARDFSSWGEVISVIYMTSSHASP